MPIKPIKRKSVNEEVFEQLKQSIISGEWGPGTKIPVETELTQLFGVSRISVRQAIHKLVGMGILNIRRGDGTYVSEALPADHFSKLLPVLMLEKTDLLEVLEFRSIIETESAKLAAARADDEDIRALEEAYKAMERTKDDYPAYCQNDLDFHTYIAIATKNSIIIKVTSIIHDILSNAMQEAVNIAGSGGGLYYHGKILEGIRNRDPQITATHMYEHIHDAIQRIKRTYKKVDIT